MKTCFATALLGFCLSVADSRAAELTVAAAANLKFALDDVLVAFHSNQPNVRVRVTYGSSGSLTAQLQNKAPFDLFLSADTEFPRKLAEAGLALGGAVFLYAEGSLVIWTPKSSPVDVERLGIQTLVEPSVKRIAIANPRHAPYGVAAVATMKSLNGYKQVEPKLVLGENVAQAAQFAQGGAADAGVIALSLALSPQMRDTGRWWEIPATTHPPIEQGGIILKWTKEPEAARAFRDFLLGEQGREALRRRGLVAPASEKE